MFIVEVPVTPQPSLLDKRKIARLEEQVTELTAENEQLKQRVTALSGQAAVASDASLSGAGATEWQERVSELEQRVSALQRERRDAADHLSEAEARVTELQQQLEQLTAERGDLEAQISDLQSRPSGPAGSATAAGGAKESGGGVSSAVVKEKERQIAKLNQDLKVRCPQLHLSR